MKSKKKLPLPKLLKKAQIVFNKFIRGRDKDNGCISCGGPVQQAGHYRSQGQFSSLRFDPINVNGQCIRCNMFLHGNLIEYRKGLIKTYGESLVNDLEKLKGVYKWNREELDNIIDFYE